MTFASSILSLGVVLALGLAAPITAAAQEVCTTQAWSSAAPLNTARSRLGVAHLTSTGKFYAVGGEGPGGWNNPIEEYDPAMNTWTNRVPLLVGISNTGAVGAGNYVYVPGGYDGSTGVSAMQRFDPLANTVTLMEPLPAANFGHAVTALNGKIYVLGGSNGSGAGTTNLIYDIASNSWTSGAAVPNAVDYPAATTDGTLIYLVGGTTSNLNVTQVYNAATNTWAAGTPMSTGRGGAAAFYDGVRVWAVGGGWASYLPSSEYWNGAAWIAGPTMNTGARTSGAAYGSGIALKAGGWNGTYLSAAEALSIECEPPPPTCAEEGYTYTKLEWCKNICERGYTGSTLAMWIRRWTDRYRTLPYCAIEQPQQEG